MGRNKPRTTHVSSVQLASKNNPSHTRLLYKTHTQEEFFTRYTSRKWRTFPSYECNATGTDNRPDRTIKFARKIAQFYQFNNLMRLCRCVKEREPKHVIGSNERTESTTRDNWLSSRARALSYDAAHSSQPVRLDSGTYRTACANSAKKWWLVGALRRSGNGEVVL